ncbi:MAG: S8 family serine peptidase [Pseudonocardiaceae bacterium]
MPDHLLLPDPRPVGSRRAGGGGGDGPSRDRPRHGAHLQTQLQQVVRAPRRLDTGIDPDLVFKIRATSRPQDGALEGRGLQMLGETRDFTYFVLTEDDGAALAAALAGYTATGALRSLLDLVNDIEPYGPEDRRGPGLDPLPPEDLIRVDISIWASPDYAEAQRRATIVNEVLADAGGEVELRSLGTRRNLIRARVTPTGLEDLLTTSVIEQIRTPPVPFLDFRDWRTLAADDLRRTEVASAVVGVLDDAPAAGHPLLDGLVESIDLIAPPGYPWQRPGDHGTEVVGRVLLPHLHEQLRDLTPITAHGTVRVARILEPDPNRPGNPPRFVTVGFPHELVEQSIRRLHDTYGVKIFNLSVGYPEPYSDVHLGPLTEVIDELVRELGIVVVVPTGNAGAHPFTACTASGHHVADDYPAYLHSPEHRLAEPAPAALAVTVGSIALSDAVAELPGRLGWQAVASVDHISPFSRTGPGTGTNEKRWNKPEVVHYGGNVTLNDSGHVVHNDPGASIVSTALNPTTGRLFAACNGTSYAVPAVARVAADIAHAYPDASANLIRALLTLSARLPAPVEDTSEEHRRAALFGHGRPDTDRAITSGRCRATMTYDGSMPVDTVHLHPVPVPEVFRRGSGGRRSIILALVFDPPVRHQRREYLAAAMQVDLYRDIDPDELQAILSRQDRDESQDLIKDRRHPKLLPGSDATISSTLQVRSWTARNSFANDDEIFYVAVTHRAATWFRNDPTYESQTYALTVTLEDRYLQEADLHQLLTQQVRLPARIRLRS